MITMAIIAGAVVGRMNFKAFVLFLIGWMMLASRTVGAHGMGWRIASSKWVPLTLLVVMSSTFHQVFPGLVLALLIGKRQHVTQPTAHNMLSIVIGGGLLWFGWFGFNSGSALAANGVAILAFLNTSIAAATAMLTG